MGIISFLLPFSAGMPAPAYEPVFEIEVWWAVIITLVLLAIGAMAGLLIAWYGNRRELRRARAEVLHWRGRQQEYERTEVQLRTTLEQLGEAQTGLRDSQQQMEGLTATTNGLRQQVNDLHDQLTKCEQLSIERQANLAQANSKLSESQRLYTEQRATVMAAHAQLGDYRARVAEADSNTVEMQATLVALSSQLDSLRQRLARMEGRSQSPKATFSPTLTSLPVAAEAPPPVPTLPLPASDASPAGSSQAGTGRGGLSTPPGSTAEGTGNHGANNGIPLPASSAPASSTSPSSPGEELTLENVKGIGTGYAARLRAAGIATVRDLANCTPEQLDAIVHAPRWRQPDYGDWIRTARLMVRGGMGSSYTSSGPR